MRIPKDCISTTISSMILRQLSEFENFYQISAIDSVCFFDYFSIHTNSLNRAFLENECICLNKNAICRGYKKARQYEFSDDFKFIVGKECEYESRWLYKIQFNPNRFASFGELESFLFSVMGYIDESNHTVSRLDIAYLLSESVVSPQLLYYTTHIKWKNGNTVYNNSRRDFKDGHMTGFSSDGGAVRISSYAENGKPEGKIAFPGYIKLELQVKKTSLNSAGVRSVYDLFKLSESAYFKRMQFYNPIWISQKYAKHISKFECLQENVLAGGFQNARKILNKNRNFDRDYGKYLSKLCIDHGKLVFSDVLAQEYRVWLQGWLSDMKPPSLRAKPIKSWMTVKADLYC